jgi:UDPglucose 6-dehydrogenase
VVGKTKRRARAPTGQGKPRGEEASPTLGIAGLGFVGVAMGVAFAHYGRSVWGFDVSAPRMKEIEQGRSPFYDPGLDEELEAAVKSGRLRVAKDRAHLLEAAEVIFLCLPTPSRPDGSVDTTYLEQEAERLGPLLAKVGAWRLIVVKSTSPPGTSEKIRRILAESSGLVPEKDFSVACNPEFLAEGSLVKDALDPSRIVLGTSEERAERALRAAYEGFPSERIVLPPASAELVKYASNALLAVKVSFANEISRVAERAGADVYPVLAAVGLDPRLGPHFLKAGPGFGGSCFPKDLKGLIAFARSEGTPLPVTEGALAVNESQARHVVDLAEAAAGGRLAGREVALLGLAFKAGTDDVRESRAFPILGELLKRGARVRLHDPRALKSFEAALPRLLNQELGGRVRPCPTLQTALSGADLAIVQCDWPEYREVPRALWKQLKDHLVVDARRSVDRDVLAQAGVRYVAVGLPLGG